MGMPEYHDGTFGPIKPIEESLDDLVGNQTEQERTKSLHIGKFSELLERSKLLPISDESEPLAKILESEFEKLRMDVNKILIHLEMDDKSKVLPVTEMPGE